MPLVDLADDLYALPAQDFTKARDEAARNAKGTDLAKELKTLKRPTASAWLINQLARHRSERLGELLDLGDELRAAQDALSGDDLRRLNRERHQLVHAVAEEAREFTDNVTEAVAREVEATLDAALSDSDAGDAIRTGRLVRALTSAGFEAVDLTGAIAVPDAPPAARTKSARKPAPAATQRARKQAPPKPTKPTKAEQAKAKRELAKARAEAEQLDKDLAREDKAVSAARERVDAARTQIDELETALKAARTERSAAEKHLETAQRDRNAVARDQRAARQRLDKLDA